MNQYTDFHKVLDYLELFQQQSPIMNTFAYGNLVDFGQLHISGGTVEYPFMFVVPQSIQYDENITTYNLTLIFADILNWDLSNEKDAVSDMGLQARRFLSYVKRGLHTFPELYDNLDVNLPVQAIPFFERFGDHVAGVAMEVPLMVYEDLNACDYYEEVTPTPTPTSSPIPVTPTITPTITSTNTPTPTVTSTPNPLCPSQLVISDATNPVLNGTYNHIGYGYSPNTNLTAQPITMGVAPDGRYYAVYTSGNNTLYKRYTSTPLDWYIYTDLDPTSQNLGASSIQNGLESYPATGLRPAVGALETVYLSYSVMCPTPTPSAGSTPLNPDQLNALWWVDFTNPSAIDTNGGFTVDGAKNLITNLWSFSAVTNQGPAYQSTGYFGVSGMTQSNVSPLGNALGVFNTNIRDFTFTMNVRWDSGQFGAKILSSYNESNYLGQQQGYNWFSLRMDNPTDFVYLYNNSVGSVVDYPPVSGDWVFLTIVNDNSHPTNKIRLYINGVLYDTASPTVVQKSNPIFGINWDGGFTKMTECFFFDRALTNTELANSLSYLQQKYPLQ